MCGIFGGIGISKTQAENCLGKILRGNDGITVTEYGPIVMGSRRHLVKESNKITAKEGASDQPYETDGKTIAVVVNGELYNFHDIREELELLGHNFQTIGDTEVFLRLYEQFGQQFVTKAKIDALFAIAIYDSTKNEIKITRDWPGRVPLFYYHDPDKNTFLYSSELKGFRALEWIDLKRPIELKPGTWLTLNLDTFEISLEDWFKPQPLKTKSALDKVGGELHRLLVNSGKNRTMGDVPISTMLSGGIDSVLSSFYVFSNIDFNKVDFRPVSYVFKVTDYESEDVKRATIAAKSFAEIGLDLRVIETPGEQLIDDIPEIIELFETRNIRALSVYPLPIYYYLAPKIYADGFKVTIGGHGVDELLGAYDSWKELNKPHHIQIDVRSRLAFINAMYENMLRRASIIFMNRGPVEARFPFLRPEICEYMLGIDPKWLSLNQKTAEQLLISMTDKAGNKKNWSQQMRDIYDQTEIYLNDGRHGSQYSEHENRELEKLFWKVPLILAGLYACDESWLKPEALFNAKLRGQHGSGITSLEKEITKKYNFLGDTDTQIFQAIVNEKYFSPAITQ